MSFLIYQNISTFLFQCTSKEAFMDPQTIYSPDRRVICGSAENNQILLQTIKYENAC